MAQIEAIDLVVSTFQYISTDGAKWDKLNGTQLEIIRQLGK